MKILVTGGAGYIGAACVHGLLQEGHRVTVVDNLSRGHRQAIPKEAAFVYGDIGDRALLEEIFSTERYEAVMHFAAYAEVGESMQAPGLYFRVNVANSNCLLEAATRHKVTRFIFSSTCSVYAGSDELITEHTPIGPANVYGHSKWMVEQILEWYHQIYGIRYATLRYFNAAGALPFHGEAHDPESHIIPRVLQVALAQRSSIDVYGNDYSTPDGTCIRDYIHIVDLASAHLLTLKALDNQAKLLYNVGSGQGASVNEVIQIAREVTGHPIPINAFPRRAGDAPRLVASAEKIRRELNWQPQYPLLKDIISTAWNWHHQHPTGY